METYCRGWPPHTHTHTTVLEKAQAGERAQQIFTLIVEAKNVYSGIKMFIRYL